jgi:hypothetical protein
MSKLLSVSFLAVVLLAGATAALAGVIEDHYPPSWRGQWSTTSQIWSFGTADVLALPDGPAPGGADPLPGTELLISGAQAWVDVQPSDFGDRLGLWDLGQGYNQAHNPEMA